MSSVDESIFNVANMDANGLKVLSEDLREMPTSVTTSSVVPLAYWKSLQFGAVLFLRYSEDENGTMVPAVTRGVFRRHGENWKPLDYWAGSGWTHDLITNPDSIAELGGRAICDSGGSFTDKPNPEAPAIVIAGRHSPEVNVLSVTQTGSKTNAPVNGRWGAWIICLDQWAPYAIEAIDENGVVIGQIQGPHRLPSRERAK
ncbi:MAG TPA: hypothetical protein VIJ40_01810 [Acidimicrobiales bacterium]